MSAQAVPAAAHWELLKLCLLSGALLCVSVPVHTGVGGGAQGF
jgi:hypothetical protein